MYNSVLQLANAVFVEIRHIYSCAMLLSATVVKIFSIVPSVSGSQNLRQDKLLYSLALFTLFYSLFFVTLHQRNITPSVIVLELKTGTRMATVDSMTHRI